VKSRNLQLVIIQTPERFNEEQTKDFWAGRVYALLDNKKSDTYRLLLEGISSETSLKNITNIFSDMENGWISACRHFFGMGVKHHLCAFPVSSATRGTQRKARKLEIWLDRCLILLWMIQSLMIAGSKYSMRRFKNWRRLTKTGRNLGHI
jgi:hypothetical protein